MKVYVLECSSGQYEDFRTWIVDIFKNPKDAEAMKYEIEMRNKEILLIEDPYENIDWEDLSETEQMKKGKSWQLKYDAEEFNEAKVKEYTLK